MTPSLRNLLRTFVVGSLTAAVLAAQKPTPPPIDPTLPDKLKELKSMVSDRKMTKDFQAIGLIQALSKEPEKVNPKDQKKLVKALHGVFRTGRPREAGKDHLYREAGDALAKFGEDGAKELSRVIEHKRIEDNVPLRAHLIEALGRTKVTDHIDYILDEATRSPHDEIQAAAGKALAEFTNAKVKEKREIVEQLIRAWGALHARATRIVNNDPNAPVDFDPQNARRTLRAVEDKWINTLSRLTGQRMTKFEDWQRWENKNPRWEPPGSGK